MPDRSLSRFRERAATHGLTRVWVVDRAPVDAAFARAGLSPAPATLFPAYRRVVVLGSAGPDFWRRLRAEGSPVPDPAADPLDRYSERIVEGLRAWLQGVDPAAVSVYPFRHVRQLPGFVHLLGTAPWLASAPFGVLVEPQAGPWWALRGALLTTLAWPPDPPQGESPCTACPAPCVAACPAGAVAKAGFAWEACADYRLSGPTCRETCLARLACPVGAAFRYDADAIAHHHRASLRELERWRAQRRQAANIAEDTD